MPVPGISPVSLMMPGMAETQVALSNIDRQRALAQALQQQSLEPLQGGASQGPLGPVTAPISWTQGLAKLLQGYTGGKMQGDLDARQLALIKGLSGQYSGMFGGGKSAPVDQSAAVQSSLSNGQGPTPENAATLAQLRQPQTSQGPLQMPGVDPATAQARFMMSPDKYMEALYKDQERSQTDKTLANLGIGKGTPEYKDVMTKLLVKDTHTPLDIVRQNSIALDPAGNVKSYNPPPIPGAFPQFQGGMPTGYTQAPGAQAILAANAAATSGGQAAGKAPYETQVLNTEGAPTMMTQEQAIQAATGRPMPVPGQPINNPGNMRPQGASTGFQQFPTPEAGLAAIDQNLQSYGKQGVNTLSGIISKWAPPTENNTAAYIADASKRLGVDPNQPLNMGDPRVRQAVGTAIMLHEQGPQKLFAQAQGLRLQDQGAGAEQRSYGQERGQLEAAKPIATLAMNDAASNLDRLSQQAQALKDHPGIGRITGLMGVIPNIPGQAGADAQAKLDTLKSQAAFTVLQAMRNASKSGGALGQVSDREELMLANNLAALQNSQSEGALKDNLQRIIDWSSGAKARMQNAYDMTYKGAEAAAPAGNAAAPPVASSSGWKVVR